MSRRPAVMDKFSVADPDLQIRGGGGGGGPNPEIKGGGGRSFSALRASVWFINKEEPGPPWIHRWFFKKNYVNDSAERRLHIL